MTRSLKNFMKAKKPMWNCGECKCITLQCRRDNDEFCNCGTSSEGLGVEYKFKDWDGRILRQGSIEEGATPIPPADPTRADDEQYTYTFVGWSPSVGAIVRDTTYVAQYEATPIVIQVQSMSNITLPLGDLIVPEGGSTTFTFDYLPANANDFSNVTFVETDEGYSTPRTSTSITSYSNGTATVTVQGLDYTRESDPSFQIYLGGVQQGSDKNMQVRPYATVRALPEQGGTLTLSKPLYIPYGGTISFNGADWATSNPATVEVYGNDTVVDTLTITATPADGYNFSEFQNAVGSDGFLPERRRYAIDCSFH